MAGGAGRKKVHYWPVESRQDAEALKTREQPVRVTRGASAERRYQDIKGQTRRNVAYLETPVPGTQRADAVHLKQGQEPSFLVSTSVCNDAGLKSLLKAIKS